MNKKVWIIILAGILIFAVIFLVFMSRQDSNEITNTYTSTIISEEKRTLLASSETNTYEIQEEPVNTPYVFSINNPDYREAMRQWVMTIRKIADEYNESFLLIPQNCAPLFTNTGDSSDEISSHFIEAIDGVGVEGISFGNERYNKPREAQSRKELLELLSIGKENGLSILAVDYCDDKDKVQDSIALYEEYGYLGFIASSLELKDIPENLINTNAKDIITLSDAENLLYLLNPEEYESKKEFINTLSQTDYDVIIIDAFYDKDEALSIDDVIKLRKKANGGKRLVVAYLSIGEAEDYRYYWKEEYYDSSPDWIFTENPQWAGNYPVKYWDDDWQKIIATGENSYLKRIIEVGFDGAYLDIVDGYETFEDMD